MCNVRFAAGICLLQLSQVNIESLSLIGPGGDWTVEVTRDRAAHVVGDCAADVFVGPSPELSSESSDDCVGQVTLVVDRLSVLLMLEVLGVDVWQTVLSDLLTTICLSSPSPRLR